MSNRIWKGVFWKILSCACFAGVNALVRYLSSDSMGSLPPLPTHTLMLFQNAIATMVILPIILYRNGLNTASILNTKYPILHFIRVSTAVAGIGLWYLSLKYMAMTQVIAISFIAPILTIIGSISILKEELTWPKGLAIALSVFGGFLISRPDKGLHGIHASWVIAFPVLAACIFAFDKMISKKLLDYGESPQTLTVYLVGFTTFVASIPFIVKGASLPEVQYWPLLILLGVLGCAAHFTFSQAYKYAEVTFLMPFGISKFILCALVGYFAFDEIPRTLAMWTGISVILASTVLLNHPRATKRKSISKPLLVRQQITTTG